MSTEMTQLKEALDVVNEERTMLRCEAVRFEEFRDSVRLAATGEADDAASAEQTCNLGQQYRETVMDTPDFQDVYDETLEESLRNELTPRIANRLLAGEPFTARLKRTLLVATSDAIQRRNEFESRLATEAESLETSHEEIGSIRSEIEQLPDCRLTRGQFEILEESWEAYERLEAHCQDILARRQQLLRSSGRRVHIEGETFALNDYLYRNLETSHPVLSAIAAPLDRITEAKQGSGESTRVRSLTESTCR